MRYLSRKKVYKKVEPQKTAKKIYIFGEGKDTEVRYFKYFQGLSSNIDIIPIPNEEHKSSPTQLQEHAEKLFFGNEKHERKYILSEEDEDEVWFVIDTDEWKDKIEALKAFCVSKNVSSDKWFVVQSNPCIELWFYYHFNTEKPIHEQVAQYTGFKEFLGWVLRNKHSINGSKQSIHPVEIETPIANAEQNFIKLKK